MGPEQTLHSFFVKMSMIYTISVGSVPKPVMSVMRKYLQFISNLRVVVMGLSLQCPFRCEPEVFSCQKEASDNQSETGTFLLPGAVSQSVLWDYELKQNNNLRKSKKYAQVESKN